MAEKQSKFGVIEGTLVYAKVGQPDTKYQSTEKEWSVEVIVDEDTADNWDETFKKQASKKIKATDFEAKYKMPCPIKGAKNVFSIKLKRAATNDGVPVDDNFRPKVFVDSVDENDDVVRTEIGQSRKIANGSYGKVSYYISTNDFGTFARLQNVLMDEEGFKEYESTGGQAGDEFQVKPKSVVVEPAKEAVMKARAEKPVKAAKPVEEESESEDSSPF